MHGGVIRTALVNVTVATLALIAGLHALWGTGSTFPFRRRYQLNDHVIGQQVSPSPAACNTVAGLLLAAAATTHLSARHSFAPARALTAGCSIVFATRAGLGFAGRTDLAVPGATSDAFRRNDRLVFSPLCTALAIGTVAAALGPHRRSCGRPIRGLRSR